MPRELFFRMQAIQKRLPMLIAALLILAMLGSLGWQGYRFIQERQHQGEPRRVATTQHRQTAAQPRVDLTTLTLFGTTNATTQQTLETAQLPKTNLRLVLRGVMASTDKGPASALVEGPDQKTQTYNLGDTLPGNAKLHAVYAHRVVIEREGRLENLYFPKTDETGAGIQMASGDSENDNTAQDGVYTPPSEQSSPQAGGDIPEPNYGLSEQRKNEIQKRLQQLRARLRANYQ